MAATGGCSLRWAALFSSHRGDQLMRLKTASAPETAILVCAVISALGWAPILWGVQNSGVMTGPEAEVRGLAIGLGVLPAVLPLFSILTFALQARAIRAARRGVDVIGRWQVSMSDLTRFAANEALRLAAGQSAPNHWQGFGRVTVERLEIIFTKTGVVVGRVYFPLVTTGMLKFGGVRVLPESPLAIGFGMTLTSATAEPSLRVMRDRSELRLPASSLARSEFLLVADYFRRVDAREIIVKPKRHLAALRIGVALIPVSLAVEAGGWWLLSHRPADADGAPLTAIVMIISAVFGFAGGIVLAIVSASQRYGLRLADAGGRVR